MKNGCIIVLGLLIFGTIGCGGMGVSRLGPGGADGGSFVTNVTYPNFMNPRMEHEIKFTAADIEILGPVQSEATSTNILGIAASGDSGYGKLLESAREQGADGVMNVTMDTQYFQILFFYCKVTMKLSGTAYRYKNKSGFPEN